MEKLKQMKECLVGIVEGQIYGNMDKVDAKELGEAVDMIKDLAEAIYYCTITEAMEGGEDGHQKSSQHGMMYYAPTKGSERPVYEQYDPRMHGKYMPMYASSTSTGGNANMSGSRYYHDGMIARDPYEGRSGEIRKMYMEGHHMKDKTQAMRELEHYMQELSTDITEMIQDASPEEKSML